jgi:hypothetical protein
MIFLYMLLGGLFAVVLPATTITTEKETRSWPILLGTTLGSWRIVLAKGLGAMRRGLLAWGFLVVHVAAFTVGGIIHPLGLVQLALVVLGLVAFLTGTGLYFSSRLRHTTSAVISNIAVPSVLWIVIPIVMTIILDIGHMSDNPIEVYMALCPFAQGPAIMEAFARGPRAGRHIWPLLHLAEYESAVFVAVTTALYIVIGLLFAWRAVRNLRRRVF